MRFRLFPSDLEGVGSYRVLYPYGCLEAYGGHDAYLEVDESPIYRQSGVHKIPLCFPAPEGTIEDDDPDAADVYVFQRRLEKWFPLDYPVTRRTPYGVLEIIRWLQTQGKTVVVEADDWMHSGLPAASPAYAALRRFPWLSLDVLRESVRAADVLTVSTPKLAELYRHPNTHVLPNYLNWPTWENVKPVPDRDRNLRVGWMGSLKWRGADLAALNQARIGDWLREHPDVTFVGVGGDDLRQYLRIPDAQWQSEPYGIFPNHAATTQQIDIGLVPLEYTMFNECKSHLKGLEYAGCGIPCIATPTGPYREWVDDGVNGMLARKPEDWTRCLNEMVNSDRWRNMGRAARAKAEQHTIHTRWREWEAAYADSGLDVDKGSARVHEALLPAA